VLIPDVRAIAKRIRKVPAGQSAASRLLLPHCLTELRCSSSRIAAALLHLWEHPACFPRRGLLSA
jgi:hypothetical protein